MTTQTHSLRRRTRHDYDALCACRPAVAMVLMLTCGASVAHDHDRQNGPAVVPEAERTMAIEKHMEGPTKNQGIKSVTALGATELGGDFSALRDRQLRARELVIEPGGVVAVHQHDQRPGVAYILEGEILEHRNDHPEPVLRNKAMWRSKNQASFIGGRTNRRSRYVRWWLISFPAKQNSTLAVNV